jgi:hypothetical protein
MGSDSAGKIPVVDDIPEDVRLLEAVTAPSGPRLTGGAETAVDRRTLFVTTSISVALRSEPL